MMYCRSFPNLELLAYKFSEKIKKIPIEDEYRIKGAYEISVLAMFPEFHSDTSCGFGGLAGQSITSAYTIILQEERYGYYQVLVNGREKLFTKEQRIINQIIESQSTYNIKEQNVD